MDGIQTHPANAAQAKDFTAPSSLSFPSGSLVTLATPVATPEASQGPDGITPTLQYVHIHLSALSFETYLPIKVTSWLLSTSTVN